MDRVLAEGMTLTTTYEGETMASFRIAGKAVGTMRRIYDELHDCPALDLTISKHRKRRSRDANAYAWVLMDRLAVKISEDGQVVSPEKIYRELIPFVGGNSKIVPVRENDIEGWKEIWGAGRTGWICEDMGPCANIAGYHNIKCFYGSSTYDTAQMSRLIELIIGECREQGIETKTPAELAALMEEWEKRGKK